IADLVSPDKTQITLGYEGWAYCARTDDKKIFLAYFEKGCPTSQIRGARLNSVYNAQWFNPRNGTWENVGNGKVIANKIGIIDLPALPDSSDWGLRLLYDESGEMVN
ncbi:MAG: putative collagen-binding domain-containing protein, partial [Bacteroidota bacterium]